MRGISFTSEMVKAIRNTEIGRWPPFPIDVTGAFKGVTRRLAGKKGKSWYKIGSTYAVNEALIRDEGGACYESDGVQVKDANGDPVAWKWKRNRLPAIFMPNMAAREFVRIVKIAKSRLGDMKPMDYVYEGLLVTNDQMNQLYPGGWDGSNEFDEYKKVWVKLWEAINGQGSYHAGVSVVEYWFKRLRCESDPNGQVNVRLESR